MLHTWKKSLKAKLLIFLSEKKKSNGFFFTYMPNLKTEKNLKNVRLIPVSFERAVEKNQMVIKSKNKSVNYDKFRKYFHKKGLMYAVKRTKGIKGSIIGLAQKIFR